MKHISNCNSNIVIIDKEMTEVSEPELENNLKSKRARRKHNCVFCDIPVLNFARHLERNHDDELQVQEFLSLSKNNPKRQKLIDKIRKEGDFCTGSCVPVFSKQNKIGLLPCIYCKGNAALK